MERLTRADLRSLIRSLRRIYASRDLPSFVGSALAGLRALVPADVASYLEMDPVHSSCPGISTQPRAFEAPEIWERYARHVDEHPVLVHYMRTGDGHAFLISDFLSRRQFHESAFYNEVYRPIPLDDCMGVLLPNPPPVAIGLGLVRDGWGFSERERLLVNLLRPHLVQARRNALALERLSARVRLAQKALEELDEGVGVLGSGGRVLLLTQRARRLLEVYLGHGAVQGSRLPESIRQWIRSQQAAFDESDAPLPRRPLVLNGDTRRLVLQLLSSPSQDLLLLEEQELGIRPADLEGLGLTRREAEVLSWVTEGKDDAAIGGILGMSARTVGKHLEHIYLKLEVGNRTSAATRALEFLGRATSGSPRGGRRR